MCVSNSMFVFSNMFVFDNMSGPSTECPAAPCAANMFVLDSMLVLGNIRFDIMFVCDDMFVFLLVSVNQTKVTSNNNKNMYIYVIIYK